MNHNNPRRWHFVLFIILSMVAIAQLSWWVIFQVQEGDRLIEKQMMIWDQQIAVAKMHAQISNMNPSQQVQWLEVVLPDLEYTENHDDIVVTAAATAELESKAKKHVRMFVSEGAFFSLLVLAGIWFLYWALRERFQIERRTDQILAAASDELSKPLSSLSRLLSGSNVADDQKESETQWRVKMGRNIRLIAGALSNMQIVRMLTVSKRRIPLKLIDFSSETNNILDRYGDIIKASDFNTLVKIADGISLVTNPERWELIARGLVEFAMRINGAETLLEISLIDNTDTARFEVLRRFPAGMNSGGLNDLELFNDNTGMDPVLGLNNLRNISDTINGRLEISRGDKGRAVILAIEFPLLYRDK